MHYSGSAMYGVVTFLTNSLLSYITIILIITLSLLMVSEIPMFSFKLKSLQFKGNELPLILIICAIAFMLIWGVIGIALTILAYILISIVSTKLTRKSVK